MKSAIYLGTVDHRRLTGRRYGFRMRVLMFYLDLSEIERCFSIPWFFGRGRHVLFGWRRKDYLGDARVPLDQAVRDRVSELTGRRPQGPIRMLTQITHLGFCFNPVTFYYGFDERDSGVEWVLAEIQNTPWNERYAYFVPGTSLETPKRFHVSPFMPMEQTYHWRFTSPRDEAGSRLSVEMENSDTTSSRVFRATLTLERRDWSLRQILLALLRQPAMTLKTMAGIYAHAAVLWFRGQRFYPHPKTQSRNQEVLP